jgi:general secretion pathway protein K
MNSCADLAHRSAHSPVLRSNRQDSQRGIALITAIILVALATVIATSIAFSSSLNAKRAAAGFTATQALFVAEGAEALAAYALREDLKSNRQDSLDETWAMPYGPVEFDQGVILEASLEDAQGRFNINNLVDGNGLADPVAREQFEHLLTFLGMETRWAQLITDWIDRDDQPTSPFGNEDSGYLAQSPPYKTPNIPVSSVSELLAMPNFGRENYVKLLPYVIALPPGTSVNPCTASGFVLDAMGPGQQEYSLDVAGLAERRKTTCYPTVPEFKSTMTEAQWTHLTSGKVGNPVADSTQYFRLRSNVTIGTTRVTLYSLMQRTQQGGQIRTILRTLGTD